MKLNRKLSIAGNAVIAAAVAASIVAMMSGASDEGSFTLKGLTAFKYFTVDSNVLMMLAAIMFTARESRQSSNIPKWLYIFKLAATSSVMLTMLVTVLFLGPNAKQGYFSLFTGPNLYFHLLVPLAAAVVFTAFEKTADIGFSETLWGLAPTALYAVAYAINVFSHAENGSVSEKYDWYGFVKTGTDRAAIPILAMLGASLIISALLWYINRSGIVSIGERELSEAEVK